MTVDQFVERGHTVLRLAMLIGSLEVPSPGTRAIDKRIQMLATTPIEAARIGLDVLNSPAFVNVTKDGLRIVDVITEMEGTP